MSNMISNNEKEDFEINEPIDKYLEIFIPFTKNIPTLEQALFQMANSRSNHIQDIELYIKDVIKNCTDYIEKSLIIIKEKYPEINKEDVIIITSYTYESRENKEFQDNAPYKILNENLLSENRKEGINKISMYLFILLKAIRKLPKYIPENMKDDKLYKYIRRLVGQKPDPKNPKFIPYCEGNIKTFNAFTSVTSDRNKVIDFLSEGKVKEISKNKKIKEIKEGTIFKFSFEEINAYDIHMFHYFGEYEILLEPEAKYEINESEKLNDILYLNCEILKSPLILGDIIEGNKRHQKGKMITK